jgi:hypothetical protein
LSIARANLEFTAPVEIFISHFRKMKNLTSLNWIKAKGFLFLALGLLSVAVLLFEHPTFQMAVLLAIAVWSFCRFYFFAFYVLEHYVDPDLTGVFCTSGSEREFTLEGSWYADEEIQAGADRDTAAAG